MRGLYNSPIPVAIVAVGVLHPIADAKREKSEKKPKRKKNPAATRRIHFSSILSEGEKLGFIPHFAQGDQRERAENNVEQSFSNR